MIRNAEPVSMIEATEYIGKTEESEKDLVGFIKKFSGPNIKEAKELRKKIEQLNLAKIKGEQISKIMDFMPENSQDLNKILTDISLDEDETKKILDAIKEFV